MNCNHPIWVGFMSTEPVTLFLLFWPDPNPVPLFCERWVTKNHSRKRNVWLNLKDYLHKMSNVHLCWWVHVRSRVNVSWILPIKNLRIQTPTDKLSFLASTILFFFQSMFPLTKNHYSLALRRSRRKIFQAAGQEKCLQV